MNAAQLFEDLVNFAGGDALEVYFGDGKSEGAFAAEAFFEGGRVELDRPANLGDLECNFSDAGINGFGFEAVGITQALSVRS